MESSQRSEFMYRGQRVQLEAEPLRDGKWTWRYWVDGRITLCCQGGWVADLQEALRAALDASTHAVDEAYRPEKPSGWGPL